MCDDMPLFELPNDDNATNLKDVEGYEGLYKVSVDGKVIRIGGKVKTRSGHTQSYSNRELIPYKGQVYLSKHGKVETFKVCDLVAKAFMPDYFEGAKVYHIDGDSDRLDNLSLSVSSTYSDDLNWKDIPGYEGYYQANQTGDIRSVDRSITYIRNGKLLTMFRRGHVLIQIPDGRGYLHCGLSVNGSYKYAAVHRLIAITFIPNPENKPQVNHKDGNKQNNRVDNLEWATQEENMRHAETLGLWSLSKCGDVSRMKTGVPVICVEDNNYFSSIASAAKFYKMDPESVRDSIRLNRPRKGKSFKYVDKEDR